MRYESCVDCGIVKTGGQQGKPRCRSCGATVANTGRQYSESTRAKLRAAALGNTRAAGAVKVAWNKGLRTVDPLAGPPLSWAESVKATFSCCVVCRSTEALEAHHIAPKAQWRWLQAFPLNGVTLCAVCHRTGEAAVHRKHQ
jgi:hypothetical protein